MRVILPALYACVCWFDNLHKFHVNCPSRMMGKAMSEYYSVSELEPLVEELIAAAANVDIALERQEKAIAALAEAYQAVEAKRSQAYQQAAE
jgi:hypothetical protein